MLVLSPFLRKANRCESCHLLVLPHKSHSLEPEAHSRSLLWVAGSQLPELLLLPLEPGTGSQASHSECFLGRVYHGCCLSCLVKHHSLLYKFSINQVKIIYTLRNLISKQSHWVSTRRVCRCAHCFPRQTNFSGSPNGCAEFHQSLRVSTLAVVASSLSKRYN